MIVDCDRHAGVRQHTDLFPYMTLDWRKHFDRYEWTGAVGLASNHIRVSERFRHEPPPEYVPATDGDVLSLVIPHQGLTVNGWADRVAAAPYVEALNSYAEANWASPLSKLAVLVSPYDVEWSAREVRRRAGSGSAAGVAMPLTQPMLGSRVWDPVYAACCETGLPLVVHYSGVEGNYLGAPPLAGGIHSNPFSRLTLMPHLAESTIASMAFEGLFARFPDLQVLFAGFGFTWLPSLAWRLDREWRTFRHDVPWVTEPPSEQVMSHIWFTTEPIGEAADTDEWADGFTDAMRERLVFGSHDPFGGDSPADVERVLGTEWAGRLLANGGHVVRGEVNVG